MTLIPNDVGMFKANDELLQYLLLNSHERPCIHLTLYLSFANGVLVGAKTVDDHRSMILGDTNVTLFVDNQKYKEKTIADMIQIGDEDLPGLVKVTKMDPDTISHLYSRLLLGHEKDQKCDKILDELTRAGLSIPAGTCRQA